MAKSFPSLSIIWIQPIHNTKIIFPAFTAAIDLLYSTEHANRRLIQFNFGNDWFGQRTNQHIKPIRKRKVIELMPHRSRHYQFTKSFKLFTKTSILYPIDSKNEIFSDSLKSKFWQISIKFIHSNEFEMVLNLKPHKKMRSNEQLCISANAFSGSYANRLFVKSIILHFELLAMKYSIQVYCLKVQFHCESFLSSPVKKPI